MKTIPAEGTESILERLAKVEPKTQRLPIVWARTKGSYVWDIAGNKFIDFTSGIFCANIGHNNDRMIFAIDSVMTYGAIHSYNYATEHRLRYLERLTEWSGFEKAFLLSAGTEATEAALKLMRLYGARQGKRTIVCIFGAFHGKTMGAELMGRSPAWAPFDEDIIHINLGETLPDDTCGVMIETFEGWSGRFHDTRQIQALVQICNDNDILVCFDEMQSGFGRTGRKFGYEHYGVVPDLICCGKGMGGGFPLSGLLGQANVIDLADDLSSTHSGNSLACAAGLTVIEELERLNLIEEAERKGRILANEIPITGRGLIGALHFDTVEEATELVAKCYTLGLLLVHTGKTSVKLGPPLTISDEDLWKGIGIIQSAM